MSYTPGPWQALDAVLPLRGRVVARGHWVADSTADNCHIIAAAPALLEVLEEIADFWAGGDAPPELEAKIRVAIALARR